MNTNTPASAAAGSSLSAGNPTIKNPKQLSVNEAVNGFVVETQRVDTYGRDMHVANDAEGVLEIIKTYFA